MDTSYAHTNTPPGKFYWFALSREFVNRFCACNDTWEGQQCNMCMTETHPLLKELDC